MESNKKNNEMEGTIENPIDVEMIASPAWWDIAIEIEEGVEEEEEEEEEYSYSSPRSALFTPSPQESDSPVLGNESEDTVMNDGVDDHADETDTYVTIRSIKEPTIIASEYPKLFVVEEFMTECFSTKTGKILSQKLHELNRVEMAYQPMPPTDIQPGPMDEKKPDHLDEVECINVENTPVDNTTGSNVENSDSDEDMDDLDYYLEIFDNIINPSISHMITSEMRDLTASYLKLISKYLYKVDFLGDASDDGNQDSNTWYTNEYVYEKEALLKAFEKHNYTGVLDAFHFTNLIDFCIRLYIVVDRSDQGGLNTYLPFNVKWGSLEYNEYLTSKKWFNFRYRSLLNKEIHLSMESTTHVSKNWPLFKGFEYGAHSRHRILVPTTANVASDKPDIFYAEMRTRIVAFLKNKCLPASIYTNREEVHMLDPTWAKFFSIEMNCVYSQYNKQNVMAECRQVLSRKKCFFAYRKTTKAHMARDAEVYLMVINGNPHNNDILSNLYIIYLKRTINVLLPIGNPIQYDSEKAKSLNVCFSFLAPEKEQDQTKGIRVNKNDLSLNDIFQAFY